MTAPNPERLRELLADSEAVTFVQQTAPERIWLTVSDDSYDAEMCFPDDHENVCWCEDPAVDVCVPYVRADLAAALLHQLAETERQLSQSRDFNAELNLLLDTAKHERDVAERARDEACEMLGWFANNPYAYRFMADKCSEAAAFLAASGGK